jgi:hypothetical protein
MSDLIEASSVLVARRISNRSLVTVNPLQSNGFRENPGLDKHHSDSTVRLAGSD